MSFELDWVRSWVEVVDSGGFARAGTRIHLSQPRVSAHVARLEGELGCVLIDRKARPLTLTEDGVRFLPRARAILSAVDDTVSEMRAGVDVIAGRLTIASFASASSEYMPGILARLRDANPHLEVAVIDGDVQTIESHLTERRAAVAIRPFRPEPLGRDLSFRGLWREQFVVLAPPGHPILDQETVTLDQVVEYPVITIGDPAGQSNLGYEAWSALRSSRARPSVGLVSHQPTTLAAMVRAGHGIGLVNQLAASMVRTDGLAYKPVTNEFLHRDVGIWWRADRPLTRSAQAFIHMAVHAPRPALTQPLDTTWRTMPSDPNRRRATRPEV
jgi:DNA-binding transcriptional LysR family regulator